MKMPSNLSRRLPGLQRLALLVAMVSLVGAASALLARPAPAAPAAGPRPGKYIIRSGADPIRAINLGYLELSDGTYKYTLLGGKPAGQGRYSFDAAASKVMWLDGPCKDAGWKGDFTIEREGKTHRIHLNPVTAATNSTDS